MRKNKQHKKSKCIFMCKTGTHFFGLPETEFTRSIWLDRLGLTLYDPSLQVCNRHFSQEMFDSSSGTLVQDALPDINLPTGRSKKFFQEQMAKKMRLLENNSENNLTQSETPQIVKTLLRNKPEKNVARNEAPQIVTTLLENNPENNLAQNEAPQRVTTSAQESPNAQENSNVESSNAGQTALPADSQPILDFSKQSKGWLDDSSNLLVDYQLMVQGKYICDVIEMPEYVVVNTVVKFKPHKIINPAQIDLTTNYLPVESSPFNSLKNLLKCTEIPTLPGITITPHLAKEDANNNRSFVRTEPEVDYVYYTTSNSVTNRDRGIQADVPYTTRETQVQCDIQLDLDLMQMANGPELDLVEESPTEMCLHECLECGEILTGLIAKQKHADGHELRPSMCAHCGEFFSTRLKLAAHEKDEHSGSALHMKKPMRCPKISCKKAFCSRMRLNRHIQQHIRNVKHKCDKCLRPFSSSLKLHCHQKNFKNCLKPTWPKAKAGILLKCS